MRSELLRGGGRAPWSLHGTPATAWQCLPCCLPWWRGPCGRMLAPWLHGYSRRSSASTVTTESRVRRCRPLACQCNEHFTTASYSFYTASRGVRASESAEPQTAAPDREAMQLPDGARSLRAQAPAFQPKVAPTVTGGPHRRLLADLEALQRDPVPLVSALPLDDDITTWHLNLQGPGALRCVLCLRISSSHSEGTPYAGGLFHIELRFPEAYPRKSPSAFLYTSLPHPHGTQSQSDALRRTEPRSARQQDMPRPPLGLQQLLCRGGPWRRGDHEWLVGCLHRRDDPPPAPEYALSLA